MNEISLGRLGRQTDREKGYRTEQRRERGEREKKHGDEIFLSISPFVCRHCCFSLSFVLFHLHPVLYVRVRTIRKAKLKYGKGAKGPSSPRGKKRERFAGVLSLMRAETTNQNERKGRKEFLEFQFEGVTQCTMME